MLEPLINSSHSGLGTGDPLGYDSLVGLAFCAEMTENKAIMDAMDKYFIMKR